MKHFIKLLAFVAFFSITATSTYAVHSVPNVQQELAQLDIQISDLSADEFLTLTPKQIKKRTGKSLSLKQIVVLKAAQKKIKKHAQGGANPKSQLTALLLVIFIGGLGIHRFYLGYTTIGIIQLLTLGGCGIWALIDLINILLGNLQPADGSGYSPTL